MLDYREIEPFQGELKDLTQDNYDKLLASIEKHGFFLPIFVWQNDGHNYCLDGHGRLRVLNKEKMEFDNSGHDIPVVFIEADNIKDAKEKLLKITSQYQHITQEGLDQYIAEAELPEVEIYEAVHFDALPLLGTAVVDEDEEIIEDEPPGVSADPPSSQQGEVYQLGVHRLMCGDSSDLGDVSELMDGNEADMVFTDPPYGYSYESNYQSKHAMLENDDTFVDFIGNAVAVSKENAGFYICAGWQTADEWYSTIKNSGISLKNMIIWKKNNWSMGDLKGAYAGQYEIIFYAAKGRVLLRNGRDRDIWEFDREPPKDHPTTKPIELVAKAIKNTSDADNVILDLFGGSGSTLMACEQTNRICYMMELDPKYCDVIRKRYYKFINDGNEEGWQEATPVIEENSGETAA